jgi:DNA polymerase-3 subunit delta
VKIPPADTDRFLQRLDNAQAVLFYGPNQTLLQQRLQMALKTWLPQGDDGFNLTTITPDQLKSTPTLIGDELATLSFFGGRKVIIFKDADDKHAPLIKGALDGHDTEHRLIVLAGELSPRSPLRAWSEEAKNAAALPCYDFEARDIARILQQQAQGKQVKLDRDAVDMLSQLLGTQAEMIPNTLDKLIDYAGTVPATITGDMVRLCCVDQVEATADDIIQHVMDGDVRGLQRQIGSYYAAGESSVGLLRIMQNYLYRLQMAQVLIAKGSSPDQALGQLKPPVFFKQKPLFTRHLQRWPLRKLEQGLQGLMETEGQCKQSGAPDELLVRQRLLDMTTA